jgi:DNA-binding MarR family transcriptional regulator
MGQDLDVVDVAGALQVSIGLFLHQLRQVKAEGELSLPETSALKRLEGGGPTTVTALARGEQISVQSMGATLSGLEARGLIERRPDPTDGRRAVLSITAAGLEMVGNKRNARTVQLAQALSGGFTPSELRQLMAAAPLIERLAQSL